MWDDFAEERVDEDGDLGAVDCVFGGRGSRQEVGGVSVGDELGDDSGFNDCGSVVD